MEDTEEDTEEQAQLPKDTTNVTDTHISKTHNGNDLRSEPAPLHSPLQIVSGIRTSAKSASVSIPAVGKKEDGSRKYNKKQFCLFCGLPVAKMARHLERVHSKESEVAKALSFTKGSKQRRAHLEQLRNRGNFAHNAEVLETGAGTLVACKQPKTDSRGQDYMHCVHCQGLYTKSALWRHIKNCKFKPDSDNPKPGKTRVIALCTFAQPIPRGVSKDVWGVFSKMNQDDIADAVKNDWCIMEYAKFLYNKHGSETAKHEYIRQKLREMGRLLVYGSEVTPLKTIKEYVMPRNFQLTVKAVKHAARTKTRHGYAVSLPLKLGYSLKRMSMLLESHALMEGDKKAAEEASTFRKIYDMKWCELVSGDCQKTLTEARWNAPMLLPLTEDVKKIHNYLEAKQEQYSEDLKATVSTETWKMLSKVTQTLILLFNRRRQGEMSKMPLSAFLARVRSSSHEDINYALSELEIKLCSHFTRIELRGKGGRMVPILLSPSMVESLVQLCDTREQCEIRENNPYLFAIPNAMSFFRGSDLLRQFAHQCDLRHPEAMTSTKLRKQLATLSTVLNLKNTESDQLADFMGHNMRVHDKFYKLPEGTLQLAKVSKILMAMEQGRVGDFQGKNLDEIHIDPRGKEYPALLSLA